MANASKKLEDRLLELGSNLASPPSSVEELLLLLDLTDGFLSRVEQSPSQSMLTSLQPLRNALVAKELLRHSDMDVKVAVASCISEITRITAPDAPYDDDLMKEIFQMIVEAFERLDDISSRSFSKRVSILETVAKVRSCVVMLDLECDDLILEMFRHFLKTIRLNHSENVFSSMETIMTLVIEESEDISSELLSCFLVIVKKDNKDVLPIARKLVEKVVGNCAGKLKSSLVELVRSMGVPLSEYSKIVASICQESSDALEHNETNASGEILEDDSKLSERTVSDELPQVSAKLEQEVGCPEKVGTAADNSPRAMMSNGTVQMGNGDSIAQPTSPKQKREHSRRNGQSKDAVASNQADCDDLELVAVKPDGISDLNTKKVRGRKTNSSVQLTDTTDHSRIDSDKEAPAVTSRRKGRSKEADSSQIDGPSGKEVESAVSIEPEKKNELVRPSGSDNTTPCVASPTPSESLLDSTRTKRGRPSGSKVAAKRNAVADQPASASGLKDSLGISQIQNEGMPSKDVDSKKELEGISDSEGKPQRRLGKKVQSDNAHDGEAPASVTSDSEAKPQRRTGKKGFKRKVSKQDSSGRKQKSNMKPQKGEVTLEKDETGEPSLKEMVSSPKSAIKAPSIDHSQLEDTVKSKSRRKRARGTEDVLISETPDRKKGLDENLVGSKIKVWWPDDKMFYDGVVDSFYHDTKKHKIVYADGDIEVLLLKKERWEFAEGDTETDGGKAKDIPSTDASEMPQSKKAKASSNSVLKQAKTQTQSKSGIESGRKVEGHGTELKGRPRSGVSNLGKLSYDDTPRTSRKSKGKTASKDKAKTPKSSSKLKVELGNESEDDSAKSGNMSKDVTPKLGGKTKGDTSMRSGKAKDDIAKSGKDDLPKSGRKSKKEAPKASSKSKDDTLKASNKSRDDTTPKTTSKSEDDVVDAGSEPKNQTPKSKFRRGTLKSLSALKIATTPDTDGGSKANGASHKGKAEVQESANTAEAQEGEVKTGRKKRKRRGRN